MVVQELPQGPFRIVPRCRAQGIRNYRSWDLAAKRHRVPKTTASADSGGPKVSELSADEASFGREPTFFSAPVLPRVNGWKIVSAATF